MKDRSTELRHRAAIGLTERTDAIAVVVVSEQTGSISIAENGNLQRNLTEKQFREKISEIFFFDPSSDETEILLATGIWFLIEGHLGNPLDDDGPFPRA